jgi:GDP-L-fucose synthase
MRVLIAGNSGLVGTATESLFIEKGHKVVGLNSRILDLTNREATLNWFKKKHFDVVIDAAAKVGGIVANASQPVEFLVQNLQIQTNLMEGSFEAKVQKFVFLGSSCIYPKNSMQPIKEEYLLTGPLEETNSAYAIAKIAGLE